MPVAAVPIQSGGFSATMDWAAPAETDWAAASKPPAVAAAPAQATQPAQAPIQPAAPINDWGGATGETW